MVACKYAYTYAQCMITPEGRARIHRANRICRDKGVTQEEIAKAVGASQSQVSRVLGGKGRRLSRLTEAVCTYVERSVAGISAESVRQNDELVDAIRETWDGSANHARALATVIRSLAALGSRSADVTRGTDK